MQGQSIPHGYCQCGCGQKAPLAKSTSTRYGHVKGEPVRYVNGHNCRKRLTWTERDKGHETPCWEWDGTLSYEGYGVLRVDYKQIRAHRWVYERERGSIPEGMAIDHLCSNKRCVNPDHLEVVTGSENSRRYWKQWRSLR